MFAGQTLSVRQLYQLNSPILGVTPTCKRFAPENVYFIHSPLGDVPTLSFRRSGASRFVPAIDFVVAQLPLRFLWCLVGGTVRRASFPSSECYLFLLMLLSATVSIYGVCASARVCASSRYLVICQAGRLFDCLIRASACVGVPIIKLREWILHAQSREHRQQLS